MLGHAAVGGIQQLGAVERGDGVAPILERTVQAAGQAAIAQLIVAAGTGTAVAATTRQPGRGGPDSAAML
jgi:hypothetical protein